MRILAVSDTESTALWDHYNSNKITNTDLILSCGDLNPQYLSFLVSCTNLPLLYVHGNHDEKYDHTADAYVHVPYIWADTCPADPEMSDIPDEHDHRRLPIPVQAHGSAGYQSPGRRSADV